MERDQAFRPDGGVGSANGGANGDANGGANGATCRHRHCTCARCCRHEHTRPIQLPLPPAHGAQPPHAVVL